MKFDATYAELNEHLNRIHQLGTIGKLLSWDEQVNLPEDSADQRAAQHSVLAETAHTAEMDPRLGEILTGLEADLALLTDEQQVVVKEARRDYDIATKLPAEFVREKAKQSSVGYHAWAKVRAESDFASYVPVL